MFANLEPRQFVPAVKGKVSLTIENLDAAETVYLHPEYEKPLKGWKIKPSTVLPNFDWIGGLLWISASADHVEIQVLEIEPERGRRQELEEKGGGAAGGAGGGDGGGGFTPVGGGGPTGGGGGGRKL